MVPIVQEKNYSDSCSNAKEGFIKDYCNKGIAIGEREAAQF